MKASEDKTFPGAIVASLASPWGQAVSAGDTPGGKPVYFGSYREIFARDLYEADTGLLAAGDVATVRDSVRFLFDRQQLADGRMPRNSLLNGEQAPDTGGDQLDESSYPILMAYQAGLAGDDDLWPKIRAAADFVVAHGPSFGDERWEEQGGYSPSTIAAEIAGLVAAAQIAECTATTRPRASIASTADHFQRSIKGWTVTTTGPYGAGATSSGCRGPATRTPRHLRAGQRQHHRRPAVGDRRRLPRAGPARDPAAGRRRRGGLAADRGQGDRPHDAVRSGLLPLRHGHWPGSEDGYGDCFEPDPTNCSPSGRPWPTGNAGSGHLWPVLSGERAEYALEAGDSRAARSRCCAT